MDRSQFEARERAWDEFHRWERSQPSEEREFGELLAWLDASLKLARSRGDLVEEPPEDKAARIARLRKALAAVRLPA